jgi:hypothetical protein
LFNGFNFMFFEAFDLLNVKTEPSICLKNALNFEDPY